MKKGGKILLYAVGVILGLYFLFFGLSKAKGFLAPLITAVVLALVVLPLSKKMEGKGLKRGLSSLFNTIFLLLVSIAFMALVSFQVKSFVDKWPKIKQTMKPKIEQLKTFALEHTPMKRSDLQKSGQQQKSSAGSGSNKGKKALSFFGKIVGFFGTFLLVFIYIFFLLNYRRRFKKFLLRLFPDEDKQEVKSIIHKSASVAQQYLTGKLMLIGLLAVLYSIGLGISGVSNFILISIIAALLTLIPYVGNIIGLALALGFGYLTSGQTGVLIGILLTFSVAQFIESYVLEPYLVGDKVDLHPFFTILVVVLGGSLWGVIGMILAIPVMAIITVIFLHVPPLHPFGFLFSKKKSG